RKFSDNINCPNTQQPFSLHLSHANLPMFTLRSKWRRKEKENSITTYKQRKKQRKSNKYAKFSRTMLHDDD
ncbi:hypothetical protein, partial [Acinetobacter baumannii]|uniref:hypothetical protein n=1 Tax=Acinetobacter baumannii TaxID=470 RepID=UPI00197AC2AC